MVSSSNSEDSFESSDSGVIKFHPKYNDPTADLVVETSDNVFFRVHTYNMRAWSAYFRDMPEFSAELHGLSEKEPIPIDITEKDFVTILQIHDPDDMVTMSWRRVSSALEAGDDLGFDLLPIMVAAKSNDYVQSSPWAVFEFAAQYEYIALARLAISYFHQDSQINTMTLATLKPSFFSEVPGDYVSALYRAMGTGKIHRLTILNQESVWEEISAAFKV